MAQAVNAFADDAPVERQPGQFRRSKQGTPYVVDPTGAVTKKGTPKLLAYGRPSGFGKQIEDGYNLAKWSERQVSLGIGLDYADAVASLATPVLASACAALGELDRDSKEFREAADAIITEAKRIAKSGLAAERGTHAHAIAEDDDEGRDWVRRAEAGEVLDVPTEAQRGLVDAWRRMLDVNGLEILATEYNVVHDGYRMAGTADRLARLTRDLHFVLADGTQVTIAAGTVIVLDIKSGKHRTDNRGVAMYWQAYAVQIATYAGGVLYDPDTDTRTPYPWPVDQRWGLIAHLDVLGAIDGQPSCELIIVDLEAGRHAAELCLAAKAWEKRTDVFSTSQIADVALPPSAAPDEQAVVEATSTTAADLPLTGDCDGCPRRTDGCPGCALSGSARLNESTKTRSATPAEVHARLRRHPDIDEGTVDHPDGLDVAFASLAKHFNALEKPTRSWLAELQVQAQRHGCGFHAKDAHTLRRFELIRGLVTLGQRGDDDDELVRVLVHHVTGDDAALFPIIQPGHALGALDATEAHAFAELAAQVTTGKVALTFTDLGLPRLIEVVA